MYPNGLYKKGYERSMLCDILRSLFIVWLTAILYHGIFLCSKIFCSPAKDQPALQFPRVGAVKDLARLWRIWTERGAQYSVKANDGKYYNVLPLILIALHSQEDLFLPSEEQDLSRWTPTVLRKLCPLMPENERNCRGIV